MSHRLDPLLRPRSIAVVGASETPGSVGSHSMHNLLAGNFEGALYAVNPHRQAVHGQRCYPSLDALPETAEHIVFAVSDERFEAALEDAIAHGAKAATIMSSLVLENDASPVLVQRVRTRLQKAGMPVCGGNGMGFYNVRDKVWASGFDARTHEPPGNITYLSQSGAGMCGIVDCDRRLQFNLVVSTGQELSVSMDEYLDFALGMPETRVIGLFIETVRNPAALCAALARANAARVPVIALKVGRTALAAQLAQSHSGALAGQDASYDALFDRYGVQRVADMDELATALIVAAQPRPVAQGGLVAVHDSGGESQLLVDLADEIGVPLTRLSAATRATLKRRLDPGLPALNPVDAWSRGGPDAAAIVQDCLITVMNDPRAAMGALVLDRAPDGRIYPEYVAYLNHAAERTSAPLCLVANRQGSGADDLAISTTHAGFPVLDGLRPFLVAARCAFGYRDFLARPADPAPTLPPGIVRQWRERCAAGGEWQDEDSARLLSDFGLPLNPSVVVDREDAAIAAAARCGYPVVLKTAVAGITHRSRHDGVRLNLLDANSVSVAWDELARRLGPRALVAPMVEQGVELLLGMAHDETFGPVVIIGAGGVLTEVLADTLSLLPPFGPATVRRRLQTLKLWPALHGSGADIDALCQLAARFSTLCASLQDCVAEIDLNPVIVRPDGCIVVDWLLVPRAAGETRT